MPYDMRKWPASVYPGEANQFPDALTDIDTAILEMRREGPRTPGFAFKPLGAKQDGLWQINLRVRGRERQIRILYAPYKPMVIVVFHIHKKSSKQEQQRAYKLAIKRKREAETMMRQAGTHVGIPTVH